MLLPYSEGALRELPGITAAADRALVLPVVIGPRASDSEIRDIAAITYAANPLKKGLDRVLAAWAKSAAIARGALVVAGVSPGEVRSCGIELPADGGCATSRRSVLPR